MLKRNPRILRYMTISYTIFLLIPIVMGSIFIYVASHVLRQNILNSNAQNLSAGAAIIHDSLSAADDLTLTISANETLFRLIKRQETTNSYAIFQAAHSMPRLHVAMHFGLTEQYLSDGFKRRAGMNFSTYLERKRILKAQEMLRTSQVNVQSIAESVGYSNIRTFRRAYSRVLGHPPSEDRKELVEGDIDSDVEKWREQK